jgi:hypothetical protein
MRLLPISAVLGLLITTGLTNIGLARAPAGEGETVCVGRIEHNQYANKGWYDVSGSDDACSFDGNTLEGKRYYLFALREACAG